MKKLTNSQVENIVYDALNIVKQAYENQVEYNVAVYLDCETLELTTLNHFGGTWINDPDMIKLTEVKASHVVEYILLMHEGLNEEQINELEKRGWLSIWEYSQDKDPKDWTEEDRFTAFDDDEWDYYIDEIERNIEEYCEITD